MNSRSMRRSPTRCGANRIREPRCCAPGPSRWRRSRAKTPTPRPPMATTACGVLTVTRPRRCSSGARRCQPPDRWRCASNPRGSTRARWPRSPDSLVRANSARSQWRFRCWTPKRAQRVLHGHHAPLRAIAPGDTVHALFSAQARRTPDATAIEAGSVTLSYAELDRRSSAWAAALRQGHPRGRHRRGTHAALGRRHRRAARDPQGRRHLSTARPGLSARAPALHARGQRRDTAADRWRGAAEHPAGRRPFAGPCRSRGRSGDGRKHSRYGEHRGRRLRHVHLGLDRDAERRGNPARRHRAAGARTRIHHARCVHRLPACRAARLRRLDARDLGSAAEWRTLRGAR